MVWHSGLTYKQAGNLERIQRRACRTILGHQFSTYTESIKQCNLDRLSELGVDHCLKFARGLVDNPRTSHLLPPTRKKRQGKKGKGVKIEKEEKEREGGKFKMEGGKVTKWGEDLFLFCFSLFKTTKICFGSTKMEIFYREKAFHARKKIRKNDFAPSEKFSCYSPAGGMLTTFGITIITVYILLQFLQILRCPLLQHVHRVL